MSVLVARGVVQTGRGRPPLTILREVSLDLEAGVTVLLGPNGSGKTTLLRTLAGLLPPVEGHVEVDGVALQDRPEQVRRLVGYLPQFPGVFRRLTVQQHLERQAAWAGTAPRAPISDILARFGLAAVAREPAGGLPAQARRRLNLALLWARRCRVLLLDEPTAGLDAEDRLRFWDDVVLLTRDPDGPAAVLVTTHLLAEAEEFADRAVILAGGRLAFQGTVALLKARADGRTWATPGEVVVPGALEVGMAPGDGARLWFGSAGEPRHAHMAPRAPTLRDGYLAVLEASGSDILPGKGGGGQA
jgi:ABC-2 type transport system ATP-binding protein